MICLWKLSQLNIIWLSLSFVFPFQIWWHVKLLLWALWWFCHTNRRSITIQTRISVWKREINCEFLLPSKSWMKIRMNAKLVFCGQPHFIYCSSPLSRKGKSKQEQPLKRCSWFCTHWCLTEFLNWIRFIHWINATNVSNYLNKKSQYLLAI